MCIGSAEEWSSKNEWHLLIHLHVQHHEIHGDKKVSSLDGNIFFYSHRITNRLIR
jgi:hypothetical protein